MDEIAEIESCIDEMDSQAIGLRRSQIERGELTEDSLPPYLTHTELEVKLGRIKKRLDMTRWSSGTDTPYLLPFASAPGYVGQLKLFLGEAGRILDEGCRVVITSYQASRLSELLQEENIFTTPLSSLEYPPSPGSIALISGSLSEGWILGRTRDPLTDAEIFGFVKQRRMLKKRPVNHRSFLPVKS